MKGQLFKSLQEIRRRTLWEARATRANNGIIAWFIATATVLGFDATWALVGEHFAEDPFRVFELPVWWRVAASASLLAGYASLILRIRLPRSMRQRPLSLYAHYAEKQLGLQRGRLVDAIELYQQSDIDGFQADLAARVQLKSDQFVSQLRMREISRPVWQWSLTVAAALSLPLIMLAPYIVSSQYRDVHGMNSEGRTILRYLEPTADHPPASTTALFSAADYPRDFRTEWWNYLGDYEVRILATSPPPRYVRLTIEWQSGDREAVLLDGRQDEPAWFEHYLSKPSEAFRWIAHGANTRTRWNAVVPRQFPVIEHVALAIVNRGDRHPLTWQPGTTIRASVNANLLVEVTTWPDDAVLTHPEAEGKTLNLPIRAGPQEVRLNLVRPDGTGSQYGRSIEIIGLTQAEIDAINAELAGGELPEDAIGLPVAADALAAAVAVGSPEQATAAELADGTPTEGEPTSGEPRENGTDGDGDGTAPPPLADAVGVLAARYDVTGEDLQELRRLVDAAPPAYRDLVAEYFLKMRERE